MISKATYILILIAAVSTFAFAPGPGSVSKTAGTPPKTDSIKKTIQGTTKTDTISGSQNNLLIDTSLNREAEKTIIPTDTLKKIDSTLIAPLPETALTNTKLFIYILLTVLGLAFFFYIFVITLFKTFHKKKSTRQSLLLSWNLFFIVTIIWIFIIWGLVAGFWTVSSFMIVVIFLFIISLIMTIIAVKSK